MSCCSRKHRRTLSEAHGDKAEGAPCLLRGLKRKVTNPRKAVVDALAAQSHPVAASDIHSVIPKGVCDLATVLEMTPAAVSQHLSRLRAGGLVDVLLLERLHNLRVEQLEYHRPRNPNLGGT